jgi:hypothetical protein
MERGLLLPSTLGLRLALPESALALLARYRTAQRVTSPVLASTPGMGIRGTTYRTRARAVAASGRINTIAAIVTSMRRAGLESHHRRAAQRVLLLMINSAIRATHLARPLLLQSSQGIYTVIRIPICFNRVDAAAAIFCDLILACQQIQLHIISNNT